MANKPWIKIRIAKPVPKWPVKIKIKPVRKERAYT